MASTSLFDNDRLGPLAQWKPAGEPIARYARPPVVRARARAAENHARPIREIARQRIARAQLA